MRPPTTSFHGTKTARRSSFGRRRSSPRIFFLSTSSTIISPASFYQGEQSMGFRKVVPDKWEFANQNFRQGHKELVSEIRRRKAVAPAPSNSAGEDLRSSSMSSPAVNMVADLSDENEKLRRENETLSSELVAAKRQRGELVAFVTENLKVDRRTERGQLKI
ncbi:PREDICTED: heat stress transcription factor B-1-like [Tarenaya hassleriana]|uniref:heat stress transcription factor B-1-like n=1 Tax=Tarenaya hassleriana TaxID=28532 RepID=UPI00053CA5DA|nr:PREDICTED: heat stress transcription factor B-1-like [Tarenaya hassleriana]